MVLPLESHLQADIRQNETKGNPFLGEMAVVTSNTSFKFAILELVSTYCGERKSGEGFLTLF